MSIQEYVAGVFRERLEQHPALVIYDQENRFREVALGLADARVRVVDADMPVFRAREKAMEAWLALPGNQETRLVVYVPRPKPVDEAAKLVDPYLIFRVGGAVFPEGASDEYKELCHGAFPDRSKEVDELFAGGAPGFDEVNALAGGPTWPRLRTLTAGESAVEILSALLAPSPEIRDKLEADSSWRTEARQLVASVLRYDLPAGDEPLAALGGRLWQLVLLSELALDLPGGLPEALQDIPKVPAAAASQVRRLCASLRDKVQSQGVYVEHAEHIERSLGLAAHLADAGEAGTVETFPFENALTFRKMCSAVVEHRIEDAVSIEAANRQSIWRQFSPAHRIAWQLAVLARDLIADSDELAGDGGRLSVETCADAVGLYVSRLAAIDGTYLSFRHAWAEMVKDEAFGVSMDELVDAVDAAYRKLTEAAQRAFVAAVRRSSWPADGVLRQLDVYDRFVAPALEKPGLTAYVLVDALRFDLARNLERVLPPGVRPEVHVACAQLPTKTEVGMAALLPQAAGKLSLSATDKGLIVTLAGHDVTTAASRDEYYRRLLGDRCAVMDTDQLLTMGPRKRLPEAVKLVIVRDRAIDAAGEAEGKRLPAALPAAITQIGKAIHKLRGLGVRHVVVAADHGFVFAPSAVPGDAVPKPSGTWLVEKDRFLLGRGQETDQVVRLAPHEVGVPCDAESLVFPRGLGSFVAGAAYCHGGLSLQEALIPVIAIEMAEAGRKPPKRTVDIGYRGKLSGRITSRIFSVDLSIPSALADADWAEDKLEILLVAHKEGTNEEVGRAVPGEHVDPSTSSVRLTSGENIKVPIRMEETFKGRFTVKALDAVSLTRLAEMILETNYLE